MILVILAFFILSAALLWYFLRHDHGRRLPVGPLWMSFGFGIAGLVVAGFVEIVLLPDNVWYSLGFNSLLVNVSSSLSAGLIEETAKFVLLALVIYKRPYFKERTDGIIFFLVCGLTFGLSENILYTVNYGPSIGIVRLILTPFFHGATTAVLGYYLASMKLGSVPKRRFMLAAITIPLLHGLYDFGLLSGVAQLFVLSLMITALLSLGLFLYFMQANSYDRQLETVLSSPYTHFCTSCGHKNILQRPFCEQCGASLSFSSPPPPLRRATA